ncbi:MMPL family transporter [Kitasatospora sp. NPDC004240]
MITLMAVSMALLIVIFFATQVYLTRLEKLRAQRARLAPVESRPLPRSHPDGPAPAATSAPTRTPTSTRTPTPTPRPTRKQSQTPKGEHPVLRRLTQLVVLPAGRRAKWAVLLLSAVLLALATPLAAQIADVADDNAASFLPRTAEATQVDKVAKRFPDSDVLPALVVYARPGGLTEADNAKIAADRQKFAPFAIEKSVEEAVPSPDGKAALLTVPLRDHEDDAPDRVKDMRELVKAGAPAGLQVQVTGPAGQVRDQIAVFDDLDGQLLMASALVVAVLLLVIYRSPVLFLLPLLAVGVASRVASGVVFLLGGNADMPVNSQSIGILTVLVFGVGTDYALLLIARYREELHEHEDRHEAMRMAIRRSGGAIFASATIVAIGLLCLLAADLNSNRSMGVVGAVGVICALLIMMTLLPALLVAVGRWIFWPFVPAVGARVARRKGVWSRIAGLVGRRPRAVWIVTAVLVGSLGVGIAGMNTGLTRAQQFRDTPESVSGQAVVAQHFAAGSGDPAEVYADASAEQAVIAAVKAVPGVASVGEVLRSTDGKLVHVPAVLKDASDSKAAERTVDRLRTAVHAVPNAHAIVGGATATTLDTARAADHDRKLIIPLVLGVVFLILALLLRSLLAPLMLMATVVLSFVAALGASWLLFEHVLHFAGVDQSWALEAFVFLVALGVDYNIFLMHRIKQEAAAHGHRQGVLTGLSVTGGVITSAGLVLAATFTVVATLPQVAMAEVGVVVAVGVVLDTFIVRSLLVPALALEIGRKVWWPGKLSRAAQPTPHGGSASGEYERPVPAGRY